MATSMKSESVPVNSIHLDPANVRRHPERNLASIKASLARFGQQRPIVIDADGIVRAGNGTLEAARELGWKTIHAVRTKLKGSEATAYAIADNRTAELAEWDETGLAEQLRSLQSEDFDLDAVGYTDDEIGSMIDGLAESLAGDESAADAPDAQVDKAEELLRKWNVKPGDLWTIPSNATPGKEHRILCGDSTDESHIAKLWRDEQSDIILTDPPYCSGGFQEAQRTTGSTSAVQKKPTIARDNLTTDGLESLIEKAISRLPSVGCCYVFCDWRQVFTIRRAVEPLGYQYRALLVWDKGSAGMGGPWRHQHELVYFGTRRKEPPTGKSGDVLTVLRSGNEHHTTEKPTKLLASILDNTEGVFVGDPFAGSGTTFVASEQAGRLCRGIEIAPKYVAVALERLSDMGLSPHLRAGG